MKVTNPLACLQAAGTLAKTIIFRRTKRGHTAYRYFKPKQPHTIKQQAYHALFGMLADRWNTLDTASKRLWEPLANAHSITRYNAYLQHNLRRLNPAQIDGLIGWWPNLVPGGSILHDLTVNNRDGEFVSLNPATAWPNDTQRQGQVIEFTDPGYVNVPTPPSTVGHFSVAAWIKQNVYTHNCAIIDTGVVTSYCFGQIRFERLAAVVANYFVTTDQIWLTDFDWHHVAFCWDGSSLYLWIDGVVLPATGTNTPPAAQTQMWIARRAVETAGETFQGRVDDLRLYARALSTADVLELASH